MTNKLVILGIAILAIGLVALPETLALFADQHTWYEIADTPLNGQYGVPCLKCHVDVQNQLNGVGTANRVHEAVTCEACHIISQTDNGLGTVGGNQSIHAAAAPLCLDCHGNSTKGQGYEYTGAPDATGIIDGANEVHTEFIANATSANLLKGSNEACVGCHTHVAVDIVWDKPTNLSFKARVSPDGVWTVDNFQALGSKNTSVTSNATGPGVIV